MIRIRPLYEALPVFYKVYKAYGLWHAMAHGSGPDAEPLLATQLDIQCCNSGLHSLNFTRADYWQWFRRQAANPGVNDLINTVRPPLLRESVQARYELVPVALTDPKKCRRQQGRTTPSVWFVSTAADRGVPS